MPPTPRPEACLGTFKVNKLVLEKVCVVYLDLLSIVLIVLTPTE